MNKIPLIIIIICIWFFSNTGYLIFPIFVLLFLILSFYFFKINYINKTRLLIYISLFLFIYYGVSILHIFILSKTYFLEELILVVPKIIMNILIFYYFLIFLQNEDFKVKLKIALTFSIVFSILTILIQAYFIYFENFHISYLDIIMGREQRIGGAAGIKGLFRLSGMYNEPGTYSIFMYPLLFSRYMINKNFDYIFILGLISTLLTFSVQAYVSFLIIILAIIFKFLYDMGIKHKIQLKLFKLNIIFTVVIFILFYYFGELIVNYFDERFLQRSDVTISVRTEALYMIFDQNILTLITGIGYNYNGYGIKLNDIGLLFTIYAHFGLLGICFVFLLGYILFKYNYFALVLFLIILLSKLSIIHPILWIYFALVVIKSKYIIKY